ncbi:antitoxin [Yimella sp. cx-51]|uniref:antitoxin n=1 Tax=Yimella sp. cx-51 TaxID=2770551 RepID=UPI00165D7C2D|nr:antitoxin [Yimella sp. cx-51]MBC9957921.1 antitoxin [Yimella sp. cx-51]MBD2759635.1 antitoxin [Yimella sp. cx-573]QTH38055.1 antitoxin [Yimella sp. cx-51]
MARTTVTLESDVEAMIARLMAERGISFKEALNQAVRRGLSSGVRADFVMPSFDMGSPLVDLTHASRIAGELEDEEIVRELRVGR